MKGGPNTAPYDAGASAWDQDRVELAQLSARRAWWTAAAGWTCALASSIALASLAPMKTVEPYVVRVDRSTGVVDVVPLADRQAKPADLVIRYFLTHYVLVCERFNFATAESDYAECGAFQTPKENQQRYARWNRGNPQSPLNRYKDGTTVEARVESINFLDPIGAPKRVAQVRYLTIRRPADGSIGTVAHFVVTARFQFQAPSSDPAVRQMNPLGFKIVDFHPEPEVISDPADATSPSLTPKVGAP